MPDPIVNAAAYQFADLRDLPAIRDDLRAVAAAGNLRGTVLLSPEGINLFVAGERAGIDALLARIRAVPGLAGIPVKESFSADRPFNRMLVKIKREIIAFGVPGIDPRRYTSRRLTAGELRRWLDDGRPVTLLDTRNDFEVAAGTFAGAVAAGVTDFRDFPAAVEKLPEDWKSRPVVTFCTGGIRCEKAAPYLEAAGFREVYQLDGGILKYFEECGGAHFRGECFVFDKRVALGPDLRPGRLRQCFVCQAVLTPEDVASPRYAEGVSCPACYRDPPSEVFDLEARQAAVRAATIPLPGSVAYDNARPVRVPKRFDGFEVLDFLDALRTHLTRAEWVEACTAGRVVCRGERVLPGRTVRAGEQLVHHVPATREPDVAADIAVLHEDAALVVVGKPAPLPVHPCGRFNRNTLGFALDRAFTPLKLRPAHRLDADTSGVVVLTKTREAAAKVQPQFEAGTVRKAYLARVAGRVPAGEFTCDLPLSPKPGANGVRLPAADGLPAETRFRVIGTFADGSTLLDVDPRTGRTNQIRVHLWALGLPVVGDPIYLPGGGLGSATALSPADPPLCLHAAAIEFDHPLTGERVRFAAPPPAWANGA